MNMSQYVDKIIAATGTAKSNAPKRAPKVAILEGTYIEGTKGFLANVIQLCGGNLIGPESNLFVQLNPEILIQADPDMIILAADVSKFVTDPAKQGEIAAAEIAKLTNDPRYKSLKAVKNKRIYPIDADVLLRKGSRVDKLIATISSEVNEAGNS